MQKVLLGLLLLALQLPVFAADEEETPKTSTGYISLGKPMVLNLATASKRLTFLQVAGDVLVTDDSNKTEVELHVPAIRHELILLLSEQDAEAMKSPIQREEIRKQVTDKIKTRVRELTGSDPVAEVLFTTFLVQ